MTREEFMSANDGREPYDKGYWGPGGVDVAGRWGDNFHMRRGCEYHVSGTDTGKSGAVRKISTGRKARGYASSTDGRIAAVPA